MIVCVGKIVAVSTIVNGPTPSRLVVPLRTSVQYQCNVLVSDLPMNAQSQSWTWLINNARHKLLSTIDENGINITEIYDPSNFITKLNVLTDIDLKLQIGCQYGVGFMNGTTRFFDGNTTATLLSFG